MSDAAIFTLVLGGLFVLRIVAATVVFVLILPHGDRCPLCDAVTLRVESPALRRLRLPLVKRWCLTCGWEGVMRRLVNEPRKAATTEPNSQPSEQPSRRS